MTRRRNTRERGQDPVAERDCTTLHFGTHSHPAPALDIYGSLHRSRRAARARRGDIKRAYRGSRAGSTRTSIPGTAKRRRASARSLDAYETLIDPDRRRRLRRRRPARRRPRVRLRPGSISPTSSRVHAARTTTFGDLFEEVFARRDRPRRTRAARRRPASKAQARSRRRGAASGARRVTRHQRLPDVRGTHQRVETRACRAKAAAPVRRCAGTWCSTKNCPHCGGTGLCGRSGATRAAARASKRARSVDRAFPPAWPMAPARGREGACGRARRRPATSTSTCKSRRIEVSAATATICTWSCRSRFTRRRWGANRDDDARRSGTRARPAGHAVGPALPPAGARRTLAARRPRATWSSRCGADAAAGARRTIEGAAAGVRADQRPERPGRSWG